MLGGMRVGGCSTQRSLATVLRLAFGHMPALPLFVPFQMEYPVSEDEVEAEAEDDFMVGPPPPELAEEIDLGEPSGCMLASVCGLVCYLSAPPLMCCALCRVC